MRGEGAEKAGPTPAGLRRLLVERVAALRELDPQSVPTSLPLAELGLSSIEAVILAEELSGLTGRELPSTLLWETPTIDELVERVTAPPAEPGPADRTNRQDRAGRGPRTDRTDPTDRTASAAPAGHARGGSCRDEPVAVVGMGCRLPGGVRGPEDYWTLLHDGGHGIREVPAGRWEQYATDAPGVAETLRTTSPWGGFLDDVAGFDAEFFGVSPREAQVMDPQQRLLLEVTWEALEHAAIPTRSLAGSATGVFVGICSGEYGYLTGSDLAGIDAWTPAGAALSIAANRLSYALDLRGPSMAVDSACSSSLVAVHQACASLRTGESDTALAAGVNLLLSPAVSVGFQRAGMLSPAGLCKAFGTGDGLVRGEGCGVVVLKRLSDAVRDGDRVLALVRGSAVNSDGRSNGLMAPNPQAQRDLLVRAYAQAGTDPVDVDYVEAHATGTPLGDPIEAHSLGAVLGRARSADQPLLLGSAKTNLGHLEAAAGIAGLIKTVLALSRDMIPPSLHFDAPSPHIDFDAEGLRVAAECEMWPRYSGRATAGVSAFGFGGTNAHVVLEEPPPRPALPGTAAAPVVAVLSDADEDRLRDTAAGLAAWLHGPAGRSARLEDIGRTLAGRAPRGDVRTAVVARDRDELLRGLRGVAAGHDVPRVTTAPRGHGHGDLVWVFPAHGLPWAGMGERLLATEPGFAEAVERLQPVLAEECGVSLLAALAGDEENAGDAGNTPQETGRTHSRRPATAGPVLFGVQVALAELWRSYGARPAAVIGHAQGEVAAAVAAGALDPEEGARLVARRSRGGYGSGPPAPYGRAPRPHLYSTVLDDPRSAGVLDATYWETAPARTAGFARAVAAAAEDGLTGFLEISPHPVLGRPLAGSVRAARGVRPLIVPTLRRDTDAAAGFRTAVATLFLHGCRVEPRRAHPRGQVCDMPAAPWRRSTYWVDPAPAHAAMRGGAADVADGADDTDGAKTGTGAGAGGGDLTARLTARIAAVMGFAPERLDRTVPLTDLGLDSLMARRVRGSVEHEFGLALPARLLLHQATIEDTAAWIAARLTAQPQQRPVRADDGTDGGEAVEEAVQEAVQNGAPRLAAPPAASPAEGPLRRLRTGDGGPPLFLAHPAGGSTAVYQQLADRVPPGTPVLGLERMESPTEVTERAARYAELIESEQPHGPYRLGGWSYGGMLAYETARLLTGAGHEVESVVLIDTILPLPAPRLSPEGEARRRFAGFAAYVEGTYGTELRLPYAELAQLDDTAQIETVMAELRAVTRLPEPVLEHQRTSALDMRSGERYTPGPYAGQVLLCRAVREAPHTVRDARYEREDAALGWDEFCAGLRIVPVSGHHLCLLDPPYVDETAAQMADAFMSVPSRPAAS